MAKSLVVKSIRFTTEEWAMVDALAQSVLVEPAVLIRRLAMKAVRGTDVGALKEEIEALRRAQDALFG